MLTLQEVQNQSTANQTPTKSIDQVASMIRALKNSDNPQALFASMLSSNPELKAANDFIGGGDGRAVFLARAREMGMTDQQISDYLNALNKFF